MKRIFSVLLFLSIVFSSNITPAYAIFGIGDIVFDPTTYIKQGFQYVSELATQVNTSLTSANTSLVAINDTVLKPLKDALTIAAIVSSSNNVQNLIIGGLGNDRLLVIDPQAFLRNKANTTIRINLGTIASQKGVYSNSILNSVINSTRGSSDPSIKLASLTQSSIPSIVQQKICKEENLNQAARTDVMAPDGSIDPAQFTERKKALFDAFCTGNPAADQALSQRLINANKQNPSIGGGDTFLALTGGDNEYTRSVRAQAEIDKQIADKIEAAKQDLISGGGIRSETRCVQTATYDERGDPITEYTNETNIPCVKETITKTSASLKTMWDDALGAPLKTLQSSLTGATSIVGTAFQTVGLLNGINSAFNTTTSNLGLSNGTSNSGNSQTNTSAPVSYVYSGTSGSTQSNAPIVTSTSYVPDLLQNPSLKTTLIAPISKALTNDLTAIQGLSPLDQNYIAEINIYESKLAIISDCSTASSLYISKKGSTDALLNQITNELTSLPSATTYIKNTLSKIEASNSSAEITTLFNNYQNQVDSKKIPNAATRNLREGEYQTYKMSLEQDLSSTGDLQTLINQCSIQYGYGRGYEY